MCVCVCVCVCEYVYVCGAGYMYSSLVFVFDQECSVKHEILGNVHHGSK